MNLLQILFKPYKFGFFFADSSVSIDPGTTTAIDTRTEATNGNHRQVIVIGDPSTNAGVAPVDATNGLSVTLTTAIPAGSAAIGKLAANSGVDIGDVDVTSVTPGTTASSLGKAEDAAHSSGDVGVMALTVRQDTAAALSGTDADYQPLITDGSGRLHVNVGNTVTVASHPVTNAGTFAVQDATSQASLSVIDDWDETDRAKVNIIVGQAGVAAGVGATGATVPRVVVANGAGRTLVSAGGSAASSGNNTLVAAGTNRLKVYAFSLTTLSTTAMTCIFQDGAGGTELWRVVLQAGTGTSTGANLTVMPPAWIFATSAATLLNLNLSSANAVHWSVAYYDEA